jgi:cob(I)alamin adenosyltransferase
LASYFTTRQGDSGTTRLLSGERVSKNHAIVHCTGQLDTFRAELAEARLLILESKASGGAEHAEFLLWLLHVCFLIGTQVNDPAASKPEYRIDTVGEAHLARLEAEQARIEAGLSLPRAFLVSATTLVAARIDVVATTARALERAIVGLAESEPAFDAAMLVVFVNRTSDYLVALARALEGGRHQPVDYEIVTPKH